MKTQEETGPPGPEKERGTLAGTRVQFLQFPFVAAMDAARRQALAKCETVIAAWVSLQYRGGYTGRPEAKFTARILREARKVIEEVRLSLQLLPLWAWAQKSGAKS